MPTQQKPLVLDNGTTQNLPAGDQLEINAGTAALPALTIDGDPNTGIYSPGADQLSIATGGAQRVTVDASGRVGVGIGSPSYLVDVQGGTLASGNRSLNVEGTLTSSGSNTLAAFTATVSSGSFAQGIGGGLIGTGTPVQSFGAYIGNSLAGTGTDPVNLQGNTGVHGNATGSTGTGHNVGMLGYASQGARNYGMFGNTTLDGAGANVAVAGVAKNASGVRIAGLFSNINITAQPNVDTSAVLIADNNNTSDPIFLARDAGTTVFTIANDGAVTAKNTANSATAFQVQNVAGTTILDVDTANQRVGIGTSAPNAELQVNGSAASIGQQITNTNASGLSYLAFAEPAVSGGNVSFQYRNQSSGGGGLLGASQGVFIADTAATSGLLIGALSTSAPVVFTSGGFLSSNERLRFGSTEVVVNDASQDVDFRVESDGNANMLFVDASTNRVGVGTSTPAHVVDVQAGTLAAGVRAINASATLDASANQLGFNFAAASAGSAAGYQIGAAFALNAGYTGNNLTAAMNFANNALGTGTTVLDTGAGVKANVGGLFNTTASTSGANAAGHAIAGGSTSRNYGLVGIAYANGGSPQDVGVYGTAWTDSGTPTANVGGMFTLYGSTDSIGTLTTAALIADNATQAAPIFLARDNGTEVVRIADGGNVGIGTPTPATALDVVGVITASTGIVAPIQTNAQAASYTLALSDASKIVEVAVTSPSTATVTVPANGTVAFPIGTQIVVSQTGTGTVSIAGDVGVTINTRSPLTTTLNGQWAVATLVKRATNTWILFGDLA